MDINNSEHCHLQQLEKCTEGEKDTPHFKIKLHEKETN
jgi:hypothetical protein